MSADLPARPEITPGYRREADREIRAFTRDWTDRDDRNRVAELFPEPSRSISSRSGWPCRPGPSGGWSSRSFVVNAFAGVRLLRAAARLRAWFALFDQKRANDHRRSWLERLHADALPGDAVQPQRTPFPSRQSRRARHDRDLHHDPARVGGGRFLDPAEIPTSIRNPLLMIPVGGLLTYVLVLSLAEERRAGSMRRALIAHNLGLALWIATIWWLAGQPGLVIYAGTVFTAGCIGVFLVYLQHNFRGHVVGPQTGPQPPPARRYKGSSALRSGLVVGPRHRQTSPITDIHHFNANIPSPTRLRKLPPRRWREKIRGADDRLARGDPIPSRSRSGTRIRNAWFPSRARRAGRPPHQNA